MPRPSIRFGAGTVLAALMLVPAAHGHEKKVSLDQVPKPVLDAVKGRFPDGRVTGAVQETENGQLVYEVTLVEEGRNVDVTASPSGALLTIEKTVEAGALPHALSTALEVKYPGASYRTVEEVVEVHKQQERLAYYEVMLDTAEGRTLEVKVTPDGMIVNGDEKDKNKSKDKNKDDDDDEEEEGEEGE